MKKWVKTLRTDFVRSGKGVTLFKQICSHVWELWFCLQVRIPLGFTSTG
jgi:hypothetical protein